MIQRVLEGGKTLTRAELAAHLKRAKVPADGLKLAYLMMHAELEGVICSGPRRGKQFTYALLDERVPATKPKTREEALAELARRYFASHGPATIRDFAWWSGLTREGRAAGDRFGAADPRVVDDRRADATGAPRIRADGAVEGRRRVAAAELRRIPDRLQGSRARSSISRAPPTSSRAAAARSPIT